jgi:hypothetical protein
MVEFVERSWKNGSRVVPNTPLELDTNSISNGVRVSKQGHYILTLGEDYSLLSNYLSY